MKTRFSIIFLAFLAWAAIARAAQPSGTLPVLHIDLEGGIDVPAKTEGYAKATYWLDPMGVEGVEAFGTSEAPLPLEIRGRGNYTWTGFDKKPFRLKLGSKAALLGMNKSKHWALLAHADDNQGFMRNLTGFQLSRMAGLAWTPGDQPVELVLNGRYWGLYFLTETVRVDSKRVNVTSTDDAVEDWLGLPENAGKTAADYPWTEVERTGGWLVEIDNYEDADQVKVDSRQGANYQLWVTYDTPSDYITEAQKQFLRDEFGAMDNLIYDSDADNCRWADKIDLTDAARFFLVNQLMGNYESYHGSCKLYRQQGETEKWHFGPVWDFGSGFQNDAAMTRPIWVEDPHSQHWIKQMFVSKAFQEEVKRVYQELMDNDFNSIYEYQKTYAQRIKAAAAADKERWPQYGNDDIDGKVSRVQAMLRSAVTYTGGSLLNIEQPDAPLTAIYLRGEDYSKWEAKDETKFTETANGVYELKLDKLSGEFKIAGPEWGQGNVDFGGRTDIALNTATTLTSGGGNMTVAGGSVENVTLRFVWASKELTVMTSGEPVTDPGTRTVYFIDNAANPWQQAYIYTWSPASHGDWPGTPMERTTIGGQSYWTHTWSVNTRARAAQGLIFNDGQTGYDDDKSNHQTGDLEVAHTYVYDRQGRTDQTLTGITDIDAEPENAPAVYYNLQGVRVDSPASGIYIRIQGGKSSKVIL